MRSSVVGQGAVIIPAVFMPTVVMPAVFMPAVIMPAVFMSAVFMPAVIMPAMFMQAVFSCSDVSFIVADTADWHAAAAAITDLDVVSALAAALLAASLQHCLR